jgi:hypothetical protein
MATGPEHYREAQSHLDLAAEQDDFGGAQETYYLRRAQVHATLALAAATALGSDGEMTVDDSDAWLATASAYKRPERGAAS